MKWTQLAQARERFLAHVNTEIDFFFFGSMMHFVNYESSLFKSKSVNLLVGSRIEILHNCLRHSGDFGANEEKMLLKNRDAVTPKTDKTTSGTDRHREMAERSAMLATICNTRIRTRHNRSR